MRFVVLLLLFILSIGQGNAKQNNHELIVAPEGKSENRGTRQSPLSFDVGIRRVSDNLKSNGVPEGGITLTLMGGHYKFSKPTVLGAEFQGTAERPIIIRAEQGEIVMFDGGAQISPDGFVPVNDLQERERLAKDVVDKLRVKTITDPALIANFKQKVLLTLTYNEGMYLPSVFPNKGYAMMDNKAVVAETSPPGIAPGKANYGIRAGSPPYQEPGKRQGWKGSLDEPRGAHGRIGEREDEMAGTWLQWQKELARNNRRNLHTGFIEANWLLSSQPLVSANAEMRSMYFSRALAYGWEWRKDKSFKVFGLLCELDQPGEWHFDTLTNRLYIYPPEPLTDETKIGLPLANGFMELKSATYVSVIGLNVRNVGSNAVYRISGGDHNLIAGCSIRNSTASGIVLSGTHNGVLGCDLVDLNHHVSLGGGKRGPNEIVEGNNYVENCHIYQSSFRHQKVNISVGGVGNRFRNNLVHNSLGQAVTIHGNSHLLEFNELFNIGYDEGDGGAMYAGGDLTGYGVMYRYNFFHHLMHVPGKVERSGIHLDDLQAGATCVGNIFYKSAGKGIHMNGGGGHTLLDNVFLEGYRGIYNAAHHGQKHYDRHVAIQNDPNHMYRNTKENYIGRAEKIVGPKGWAKSPWKEKYPLFNQVMSDDGQYGCLWPIHCKAEGNLYYGNTRSNFTEFTFRAPEVRAKNIIVNDGKVKPEDFVDYSKLDLRFKPGGPKHLDIPFEKIGLYLDTYRTTMPKKSYYRNAINRFYAGIGSMPGTTSKIDTGAMIEQGEWDK